MRKVAGLVVASLLVVACATGTLATGGDDTQQTTDSGTKTGNDSSTEQDSSKPPQDSGTQQDSSKPPQDSGTTCTQTLCNNVCVDTTSDSQNCGKCSNACPSTATCQSSTCVCGSGTLCSNACVDTTSDNSNCGQCGKTCTSSQTCTNSVCTAINQAPPQGTCAHSLCTTGTYLDDLCDYNQAACVYSICDINFDSYCCSSAWDSICVGEVADYCSPYTCN